VLQESGLLGIALAVSPPFFFFLFTHIYSTFLEAASQHRHGNLFHSRFGRDPSVYGQGTAAVTRRCYYCNCSYAAQQKRDRRRSFIEPADVQHPLSVILSSVPFDQALLFHSTIVPFAPLSHSRLSQFQDASRETLLQLVQMLTQRMMEENKRETEFMEKVHEMREKLHVWPYH
jgi:galactose-1-phosphate uridylyltransferase